MDGRTGKLVEISPWGTGFIEDTFGKVFGFHYSMLAGYEGVSKEDWSLELENRPVTFTAKEGVASNVILHDANTADPGAKAVSDEPTKSEGATGIALNAKAAS
jgi:hypothetical protein